MSAGTRLKEERERIGMTQEQFSSACGVRRRAQSSYENDERFPDAKYLAAASDIGVDVGYVLTGRRLSPQHPQRVNLHDFGWAAASILGISEQAILIATQAAKDKLDAHCVDADVFGIFGERSEAYLALFYVDFHHAIKPIIENAILAYCELDAKLLSSVLEGLEAASGNTDFPLSPDKKAAAAVMLYRAFKASGKVDQAMIEEAAALAGR